MAPPTAHQRRNGNAKLLFLHIVLALVGLYTMRIVTSMNGVPVGLTDMLETRTLPNGAPLKTDYTGIRPVDDMLALLVAAFIPGPLRMNEAYYWQQIHFLLQIGPVIAVQNVEACRERNQGSWLK
jgi:hypothetical protein